MNLLNRNRSASAIAVVLIFVVAAFSPLGSASVRAQGRGGGNGNGGGGGGGGEDPAALYDLIELPIDTPFALSEVENGEVVAVGEVLEQDKNNWLFRRATYALVGVADRSVLANDLLPVPTLIDPDTEMPAELHQINTQAHDVNRDGTIVGMATVTGSGAREAVIWTSNGTTYQLEVLPSLDPSEPSFDVSAIAINDQREIVGRCDDRAVYWDPATHEISDLNTPEIEALGWHLRAASDINELGQIVGVGWLNQRKRAFRLDPDGQLHALPLIGPAEHQSSVASIDEFGRCTGYAYDGVGQPTGPNPDYVQAFYWDGPGTDPVPLPSVTNQNSTAREANDLGEAVGTSYIPADPYEASEYVATLWTFDLNGQVMPVALDLTIDSQSKWALEHGMSINNDGWILVLGTRNFRGGTKDQAALLVPR